MTKHQKALWQRLRPLEAPPRKYKAPTGTLALTVAAAVAWAALLVILVGNWTVPIDKILP